MTGFKKVKRETGPANADPVSIATTSLSLGSHWEVYIRDQVASGRYGYASEVIRAGLRSMEEDQGKLEALREHLSKGMAQAKNSKESK